MKARPALCKSYWPKTASRQSALVGSPRSRGEKSRPSCLTSDGTSKPAMARIVANVSTLPTIASTRVPGFTTAGQRTSSGTRIDSSYMFGRFGLSTLAANQRALPFV